MKMDTNSRMRITSTNTTTMSNIENRRRKNVTIRKSIILGTYAFMLSIAEQKKRGDNATHSWTCLLRSPDNEDISYYIRKVVFSLHPSFLNPNRVVEKCPFEVTECGWGEFDIIAKIYFVDSTEKPVEIKHFLRLYPPGTTDVRSVKFPTDNSPTECVASETCDEFIFHEPTEKFYEKLINGPIQPPSEHRLQQFFHKTDKSTFEKTLAAAHVSIQNEMASLRAEIAQITLDIQNIRENYYSLRPNEVASLFPQTNADPNNSINSPNQIVDSKNIQVSSQQIEHNITGRMVTQKTDLYARSPQNSKAQNIKVQNIRSDNLNEIQLQSNNIDQLNQYQHINQQFDNNNLIQPVSQQYSQPLQQQKQGHYYQTNHYENTQIISHTNSSTLHSSFKHPIPMETVNLDSNRSVPFQNSGQVSINRTNENIHTIVENDHIQYSIGNLPTKIETHGNIIARH